MQPEPYNSGDPEQVKSKKTRAKHAEDQHKNDLRAIMATVGGRRYLWALMGACGVFSDTGSVDPLLVGRFLGRRSLGLELLAEVMTICPDEYLLMQSEAMKQDKEDSTNAC